MTSGDFLSRKTLLSPCRKYRYVLWRDFGMENQLRSFEYSATNKREQFAMFIGLNPSTADETNDDPTIRKCVAYAKRWGYGALCMVNLFAFRATLPKAMLAESDPIGPENDAALKSLAAKAGIVIAAWGKDGSHLGRDRIVTAMIPNLHCLKQNNDQSPSHPLYLRGDLQPFLIASP